MRLRKEGSVLHCGKPKPHGGHWYRHEALQAWCPGWEFTTRTRLETKTRRCDGGRMGCLGNFMDVPPVIACCAICHLGFCAVHLPHHHHGWTLDETYFSAIPEITGEVYS